MLVAQPLTVCGPALSLMFWSAPLTNDGGSLIELTVIVKVCAALVFELGGTLLPLSLSVTLIFATPLVSPVVVYVRLPVVASIAGALLKVRLPVVPVTETLKVRV